MFSFDFGCPLLFALLDVCFKDGDSLLTLVFAAARIFRCTRALHVSILLLARSPFGKPASSPKAQEGDEDEPPEEEGLAKRSLNGMKSLHPSSARSKALMESWRPPIGSLMTFLACC